MGRTLESCFHPSRFSDFWVCRAYPAICRSPDQAQHIADSLLEAVKDFHFAWRGKAFDVGISIGLVAVTRANAATTDVLSAADMACYAAKQRGRNRVHVYESDEPLARRHGEPR